MTALIRQKHQFSPNDKRLTHDGEDLPDTDGGVEASFPKVIGKLASQNRNYAAAEVR